MSNGMILPEVVVKRMARECAERVRDAVNGYAGRERLVVNRVTVVDQQACIVWDDVDAPAGDELRCVWEQSIDTDKVIEMVIAGPGKDKE